MLLLRNKQTNIRTVSKLSAYTRDLRFSLGMRFWHFVPKNTFSGRATAWLARKLIFDMDIGVVKTGFGSDKIGTAILRPIPKFSTVAVSLIKTRLSRRAKKRGEYLFAIDLNGKPISTDCDLLAAVEKKDIGGLLHYSISPNKIMHIETMSTNPFDWGFQNEHAKSAKLLLALEREIITIAQKNDVTAVKVRSWIFAAHPNLLQRNNWVPIDRDGHARAVGFFEKHPWAAKVLSGKQLSVSEIGEDKVKSALSLIGRNRFFLFPEYHLDLGTNQES